MFAIPSSQNSYYLYGFLICWRQASAFLINFLDTIRNYIFLNRRIGFNKGMHRYTSSSPSTPQRRRHFADRSELSSMYDEIDEKVIMSAHRAELTIEAAG